MRAPASPLILAIDLGTTACKVALVTPQGRIVAHVRETDATPTHFLPGGGAEQDPRDWWSVITRLVRRVLNEIPEAQQQVIAIACSTHWSGTVAVDPKGEPLHPAIIWMDTRGAPYVREITGGFPSVEGYGLSQLFWWIRLTGGIPTHSGKDPIAHILFLKHEKPEVYRAAYKFLEPKDYINLRLTGKFASDYATIVLHWVTDNRHIDHVDYHPRLLQMAGLEREKLPDLYPTTHVLGPLLPEPAEELGLQPGIPVVMGTPDVQAPALGSGAVQDYEPHIYIGTSSWITCHVPVKKTDLFHNMASLPAAVPGRYFIANEQETAGASLTFLRDAFFYGEDPLGTCPAPEDAYARMDALAAQAPPGARGVTFFPWLYGERTPVEDPDIRGGFLGLSLGVGRAEVARAVLEGVALNLRWLLGYVEKFAGRRFETIRFIGGGARSDLWSQILADVLDRPIAQVEEPDLAGVRGVALLAGLALGMTRLEDMAAHVPVKAVYSPNPRHRRVYEEKFRAFLDAYRRLKGWYRRQKP